MVNETFSPEKEFAAVATKYDQLYGTTKYGAAEESRLVETIRSGYLFYAFGERVYKLSRRIADIYSVPYCTLTSSGTAALHTAMGAVGVDFGDEVITTPITDTGTVIGILLRGSVPVFADVDERNFNISPSSIKEKITPRTKAILVVHYGGYPCDMDSIMEIAKHHNLAVVEDCCQGLGSTYKGRSVGTIGDAGCYSTNDTKQISSGDGGFILSKDEVIARRARLFHDKGFDRKTGQKGVRDPEFLAPNYRMTELQAAVLEAQFDKFPEKIGRRKYLMELLCDSVANRFPEIGLQHGLSAVTSGYFNWSIQILTEKQPNLQAFCAAFKEVGIRALPGGLYDVLYKLKLFNSSRPRFMDLLDNIPDYSPGICPVAEKVLARHVRIVIDDALDEDWIERIERTIPLALKAAES
jgi:perosamine synthetase